MLNIVDDHFFIKLFGVSTFGEYFLSHALLRIYSLRTENLFLVSALMLLVFIENTLKCFG